MTKLKLCIKLYIFDIFCYIVYDKNLQQLCALLTKNLIMKLL